MRLPKQGSNYRAYVDYGRYVIARLQQDKREAMSADVECITQAVKDRGREWEDATELLSSCLARRDASDEALDSTAKVFRLNLASRAVGADKVAPYTSIFPKGLAYYTAAPLPENVARYKELLARAAKGLSVEDPALVTLKGALPGLIEAFSTAVAELAAARTAAALARTALESTIDEWVVQIEKTYGALAAELTRAGADRFFPRAANSSVAAPEEPTTEPTNEPTNEPIKPK